MSNVFFHLQFGQKRYNVCCMSNVYAYNDHLDNALYAVV